MMIVSLLRTEWCLALGFLGEANIVRRILKDLERWKYSELGTLL